jgi:hypothetical protein
MLICLYIYRHVGTVIDQTRVDYCILVGKLTLVWCESEVHLLTGRTGTLSTYTVICVKINRSQCSYSSYIHMNNLSKCTNN